MAKLTLQFEGRDLKEFVVGKSLTIGRLPDNTIVIDNPAVSAHHARVFRDGEQIVVEDLKSTNGTFVNEQHVERRALRSGDTLLIGKHKLAFDALDGAAAPYAPQPSLAPLGDTVYLDTKKHRELLATLRAARAEADQAVGALPTVSRPVAANAVGVLHVVSGRTEQTAYDLETQTSLIGRSDSALVRLRGWFKPDVAVAIARNDDGYVATQFGGRTLVNNKPLRGRHHLRDGDILSVSGLTLEFRLKRHNGSDAPSFVDEFRGGRFMSAGERAATFRALT
jgi:pSer/pThr/pTyr-binding forkhead associated (FHA) protein